MATVGFDFARALCAALVDFCATLMRRKGCKAFDISSCPRDWAMGCDPLKAKKTSSLTPCRLGCVTRCMSAVEDHPYPSKGWGTKSCQQRNSQTSTFLYFVPCNPIILSSHSPQLEALLAGSNKGFYFCRGGQKALFRITSDSHKRHRFLF